MRRPILSVFVVLVVASSLVEANELEVLRRRYFEAKPHTLRAVTKIGDTLPLRLFDDAHYNAKLTGIEDSPLNGFVWRGQLEDTPGGWVVLVENDGCMAGTVATTELYYRILCDGRKQHVIEEVVPPEMWSEDSLLPETGLWDLSTLADADPQALETDEIIEMDVMVVYTRKAAKKLFRESGGGFANKKRAMEAYIQLAVAIGNTALENSEVNLRLRLVKMKAIGYKATGDSSLDLRRFRLPEDGIIDKVHLWRERYGADFAALVLEDFEPEFSGRGYQIPPGPDTERYMFSVVAYDALWWYTLVHELGHNMGLAHDKENDDIGANWRSYRYSRGYRDPSAGFRTIMSYRTGCDACRWQIPHFANKQVKWQGAPTNIPLYPLSCGDGVNTGPRCGRKTGSGSADTARSLNNTRDFYYQVRSCEVRCGE